MILKILYTYTVYSIKMTYENNTMIPPNNNEENANNTNSLIPSTPIASTPIPSTPFNDPQSGSGIRPTLQ